MPFTIYALVDCNNFFVSCERVFNPKLLNRPVVVLSSNDGCVISRSNEAKSLDIAMGVPFFKIRDIIQQHNVAVLSSNFALYGDLSTRIMNIISQTMPDVEIYSVDEAFIDLSSLSKNFDVYQLCVNLGQKLEKCTGIPVSIGIASSKTLAKVANQIAKTQNLPNRVYYLDSAQKIQSILATFKVRDIWGIGRKLEKKLNSMGINTASELITISQKLNKNTVNIITQRTILELQGKSCIALKDHSSNKQQIMISRSFGSKVTDLIQLQEALATYVSMACVKLRKQNCVAGGFYVFLRTGLYGLPQMLYKNSIYTTMPTPSSDTRVIIRYAKQALTTLFKPGYRYQKVGIILCDLLNINNRQTDLFESHNLVHDEKLMHTLDSINKKFGAETVQFAASGFDKKWKTQSTKKSNNYTSNWQELPIVRLD